MIIAPPNADKIAVYRKAQNAPPEELATMIADDLVVYPVSGGKKQGKQKLLAMMKERGSRVAFNGANGKFGVMNLHGEEVVPSRGCSLLLAKQA